MEATTSYWAGSSHTYNATQRLVFIHKLLQGQALDQLTWEESIYLVLLICQPGISNAEIRMRPPWPTELLQELNAAVLLSKGWVIGMDHC